jgi:hypothetical protein
MPVDILNCSTIQLNGCTISGYDNRLDADLTTIQLNNTVGVNPQQKNLE